MGLLSHLSIRPGHHQHPSAAPFSYGSGSPAELANNLQHLQHLHSVQQQIAAAAAAAAAAGASNYWTSLKGSALPGGTNGSGRDSEHHPPSWRFDQQQHGPPPLSSSPLSGKTYLGAGGIEAPNPVALLGGNKRKRSTGSENDDGDRANSAASFNHDGESLSRS